MSNSDEEEELRNKLARLEENDPSYAAALNDLAVLKLNQVSWTDKGSRVPDVRLRGRTHAFDGTAVCLPLELASANIIHTVPVAAGGPVAQGETEEAQLLLGQLHALRAEHLNAQAEAVKQSASEEARSGTAPHGTAGHHSDASSAASGTVHKQPCPGPPLVRPRFAGNGGMSGGVAMFARALGGGRSPAGARRLSSGPAATTTRPSSTPPAHEPGIMPQSAPGSRSASGPRGRPGPATAVGTKPAAQDPQLGSTAGSTTAEALVTNTQEVEDAPQPDQSHAEPSNSGPQREADVGADAPLTATCNQDLAAGLSEAEPTTASLAATAALHGARRPSYEQSAAGSGSTYGTSGPSSPAKSPGAPAGVEHDDWAQDSDEGSGSLAGARGHDYRQYAERDTGSDAAEGGALRASLGDCLHVVEVYGLTTEIRTWHLEEFVTVFCTQEGRPLPVVKWVDDHHALLVCPDIPTARCLLQEDQGVFQLRPFSEASAGAHAVAPAELLPPRERPKTTAAVAKRLLSHALGRRELIDRGAEKDLAEQRKAAREARREREQKIAAAWDDE